MMIRPVYTSLVQGIRRALVEQVKGFDPISLFGAGEQGAWYDPSDMTTLYQNIGTSTGPSQPVTATGQPVGLALDLSRGLARGSETVTNGDFSAGGASWTQLSATLTVVNGVGRHAGLAVNGANQNLITLDTTKLYELVFEVVENTDSVSTTVSIREAATTTQRTATEVTAGQTGTFRSIFRPTANASRVHIRSAATSTGYVAFDNISVREIQGNHAEQLTAGSRPTFRDVGGLRYLEFDGLDDFLVTAAIDFTATDKVSVFAGMRKNSDATVAMLAELSVNANTNNGSWFMAAPITAGLGGSLFQSRGTAVQSAGGGTTFVAPASAALTGLSDISAPMVGHRRNGESVGVNTLSQGTGTYGTYQMFIGRRGGTTLAFTGNLYGLLIRGSLTSQDDIVATERFMATKSGVVIP